MAPTLVRVRAILGLFLFSLDNTIQFLYGIAFLNFSGKLPFLMIRFVPHLPNYRNLKNVRDAPLHTLKIFAKANMEVFHNWSFRKICDFLESSGYPPIPRLSSIFAREHNYTSLKTWQTKNMKEQIIKGDLPASLGRFRTNYEKKLRRWSCASQHLRQRNTSQQID